MQNVMQVYMNELWQNEIRNVNA